MSKNKVHFYRLLLQAFQKRSVATETAKDIFNVYEECAISDRICRKSFELFGLGIIFAQEKSRQLC